MGWTILNVLIAPAARKITRQIVLIHYGTKAILLGVAVAFAFAVAFCWTLTSLHSLKIDHRSNAQLACNNLTQTQLLNEFSDNAPVASITPANIRDVICTTMNPVPNAVQNGADVTGAADSTAAVQTCLNNASAGTKPGICRLVGIIKLAGTVTVPSGATLDCGVQSGAGLSDPSTALVLTGPRILVNPANPILFSGTSSTLQNCVVVPIGMTFPQTSSSAWTGTAINTNGASAPQLINVTIAGFDTCINTTTNGGSLRPLLRRIYCDGNGVTNGGAIITGNNGDLATLEDVALQVLATSSNNCNRVRQGTGLLLTGSAWGTRLISQDFQVADFKISNTGSVLIGDMWTDDTSGLLGCSFPADVGLIINNVADVDIKHIDVNANFTGVLISNQTPNQNVHIHDAFLNGIRADAFDLGAASGSLNQQAGGVVQLDMIRTNQNNPNVAGFAVNILDTLNHTTLVLNGGHLLNVHGSTGPYINIPASTDTSHVFISNVSSDLSAPVNLYGVPSIASCTGFTGTCTISTGFRSDPFNVFVVMTPASAPSNTGVITINLPITTSFPACQASYLGGWLLASNLVSPSVVAISGTQVQVNWSQTGNLSTSTVYGMSLRCSVH